MVTGSPAQQMIRSLFKEAVNYCKNPANRGGKKFQRCVGDYIKAKLAEKGHVPKKARRAKRVAVTAM
jgi:hypothetical protein